MIHEDRRKKSFTHFHTNARYRDAARKGRFSAKDTTDDNPINAVTPLPPFSSISLLFRSPFIDERLPLFFC